MSVLTDTRLPTDDTEELDEEWFCISVPPFFCNICQIEWTFGHDHDGGIVVWPEKDDPKLLEVVSDPHLVMINPRIVPYQDKMGKCISYYKLFP